MSISDEIERLERLRADGTLTNHEFQEAKARVIHGDGSSGTQPSVANPNEVFGIESKTWCMLMHLSQLLTVAGGTGIVIPAVMWVVSKDKNSDADRQGVAILNWIITLLVYLVISAILALAVVGFLGLIVFGILSFVFPIIGAIKAANGEFWEYPMSIRFIKYEEDFNGSF